MNEPDFVSYIHKVRMQSSGGEINFEILKRPKFSLSYVRRFLSKSEHRVLE